MDEIDNVDIGGIRARDPQVIGAGDRGNAYQVTGEGRPGAGPQPKRLRSISIKNQKSSIKTYQKKTTETQCLAHCVAQRPDDPTACALTYIYLTYLDILGPSRTCADMLDICPLGV